MLSFQSESEVQTQALGTALAAHLRSGDIIALEGPLGSGKTCFVRGLAQGLGIDPAIVCSPTFVLCQEYQGSGVRYQVSGDSGQSPNSKIKGQYEPHDEQSAFDAHRSSLVARHSPPTLIHIDAYRLSGPEELETIGFNELLEAPDSVIAIEWPSRVGLHFPSPPGRGVRGEGSAPQSPGTTDADQPVAAPRMLYITFQHAGQHSRSITITAPPEIESNFAARVKNLSIGAKKRRVTNDERRTTNNERRTTNSADGACRACGRPIDPSIETFPFCSLRCKMADLGQWFRESYRVTRPIDAPDEQEN